MSPQELRERFQGVIAFPITPFHPDLSLNLVGFRSNLEKICRHPFCAVVVAGGTGELYSLAPAEHLQLIRAAAEVVNGKMPILAGVGFGQCLAVELARHSAEAGADGILAFPPYYPQAADRGLFEYYQAIGKATPLGLVIYSRDWANFTPAQVEQLTQIPTLIAWKDGQGDIRRYQFIRQRIGKRLSWIGGAGDDLVPGYYSMGIRTFTSSISNGAPRLALELHATASVGKYEQLNSLLSRFVLPLYELRSRRKGYEVSAMKCLLDLLGQAGGPVRPPLLDVQPQEREELQLILKSWKDWLDE